MRGETHRPEKPKRRRRNSEKASSLSNLGPPKPYEFGQERRILNAKQLPAQNAIAWKQGRNIAFSLRPTTDNASKIWQQALEVASKWLVEIFGQPPRKNKEKLSAKEFRAKLLAETPHGHFEHRPGDKSVKCLVYHSGDRWRVWKPSEVWESLGGGEGGHMQKDYLIGEGNAFWDFRWTTRPREVCLIKAKEYVREIASLYTEAVHIFPGFEDLFLAARRQIQEPSRAAQLAVNLQKALRAIESLVTHVCRGPRHDGWPDQLSGSMDYDYCHAGRILEQGAFIGKMLAEAEAIISSECYYPLLIGRSTLRGQRTPSREFWSWLLSVPEFIGRPPDFVFNKLNGMACPAYGGQKLSVVNNKLFRPNDRSIDLKSFRKLFPSKAKKAECSDPLVA